MRLPVSDVVFSITANIPLTHYVYIQKINNMKNLPEKIYLQIGEEADIKFTTK
jgi:hypothetical protein